MNATHQKTARYLLAFLLLLICASCDATGPLPAVTQASTRPTLAPMIEKVLPGVVNISTTSKV
jgi:S1-C subfamily serine protease